jgi:hypothetical protein
MASDTVPLDRVRAMLRDAVICESALDGLAALALLGVQAASLARTVGERLDALRIKLAPIELACETGELASAWADLRASAHDDARWALLAMVAGEAPSLLLASMQGRE